MHFVDVTSLSLKVTLMLRNRLFSARHTWFTLGRAETQFPFIPSLERQQKGSPFGRLLS